MRSPIRRFRLNSPFDKPKSQFIITKFLETRSLVMVMRAYRKKFCPKSPRSVPGKLSFMRLLQRFEDDASVRPISPLGKSKEKDATSAENIAIVKDYFKNNKQAHIRQSVGDLGLSYGMLWRILRKSLKWKSYRPHKV